MSGKSTLFPVLLRCLLAVVCMAVPLLAGAADNALPASERHANPNELWHLIHDLCEPAAVRGRYPPKPCIEISAPSGSANAYAVLKDLRGRYQYLVLPLARITGIESPALLVPGAPDYFADAWAARLYVEAALHRIVPRDDLVMVVNSIFGRSQNQLHIHVDCIQPAVHDALTRMLPAITNQWRLLPMPLPPHGHRYWARRVDGNDLSINPFQSLAAALPSGDRMALHSLIVTGAYFAKGKPGFILLSGHVDRSKGDFGSGDELQDLTCSDGRQHHPHPNPPLEGEGERASHAMPL